MIILIASVWIICGVLTFGASFALLQKEWPSIAKETRLSDATFSLLVSAAGPVGLLAHAVAEAIQFSRLPFITHGFLFYPRKRK